MQVSQVSDDVFLPTYPDHLTASISVQNFRYLDERSNQEVFYAPSISAISHNFQRGFQNLHFNLNVYLLLGNKESRHCRKFLVDTAN